MKKILSLAIFTTISTYTYQQVRLTVNSPDIVKRAVGNDTKLKVIMWGKHDTMEDLTTLARLASPNDGCEPYTNPVNRKNDKSSFAYFIKNGGRCSLSTQIHNAQVAGAVALIIEHHSDNLDQIQVPDHISGNEQINFYLMVIISILLNPDFFIGILFFMIFL